MIATFLKIFWHLKVTQPFICFRVNQVYVVLLSQSNIFISSPRWIFISSPVGFLISLVENLLLRLTPEKFWKFGIFPSESSCPYRGSETGCLERKQLGIFSLKWKKLEIHVEDLKLTLILQKRRFLLILFFKCVLKS